MDRKKFFEKCTPVILMAIAKGVRYEFLVTHEKYSRFDIYPNDGRHFVTYLHWNNWEDILGDMRKALEGIS